MAPILDFEVFFHTEMLGSVRGVTRLGISLPSSGFILLWDPELLLGVHQPKPVSSFRS
jgi:hypothetical protein